MHIDILTIFPDLIHTCTEYSILARAKKKNIVEIKAHNLRDYASNKHKKVDDYPYGGGPGMVMMAEPFARCIDELSSQRTYQEIILLSPAGEVLNQQLVNQLSVCSNIMLLCGHYKGVDERLTERYVTKQISIGDYVLTGGELPAAILIDALVRLLPGVLSDAESALNDSFQNGLLSEPVYTRPYNFRGDTVPKALLSGNPHDISKWRFEKALQRTKLLRPDLLPPDLV